MPVAPALMILFQVERHDSELHRPCSAAPHDPAMLRYDPTVPKRCLPRVGRRVAARFVSGSLLLVSFCLPYPRSGVPWHQARRDPTGLGRTIIWFGAWHQILLDHGDAGVDGMFARVCDASSYPYPKSYRPWFGPNSNTFLAHIARRVPGLAIQLPSNAVGKDFLPDG